MPGNIGSAVQSNAPRPLMVTEALRNRIINEKDRLSVIVHRINTHFDGLSGVIPTAQPAPEKVPSGVENISVVEAIARLSQQIDALYTAMDRAS